MKNKVCIIGFNYSLKVLLQSFLISNKFNVVGISGKSKRENIFLNSIKYFTSWKKMILEMKPNIVALAVPPKEQEKILPFLLKHKIHFLCEKPITNNNKKLYLFLKQSKVNNKIIRLIDLNFITIPAIQKFKNLIKYEKLNKKTKIKIEWYFKPGSLKINSSWKNNKNKLGDELNNFFFHLISVTEYIFGNLEINLVLKKGYFYSFLFKNKKISFFVFFYSRSNKNLFKITFNNMKKTITLINKSKDYHNNYYIYKGNKKIYAINFDKKNSRIRASKRIIDIFLGRGENLKKYLEFKNGLRIQKKINNFL